MSNLPKKFSSTLRPRSLFDPWFSEFFDDNFETPFRSLLEARMHWDERMGCIDFEKTENEYTIMVDVPGLTKDDIKVDIDHGVMTVSAERKPREKKEGVEYLASERSYRRFSRSFSLPEDVDLDKTDAKVENGVLTMTIGRKVNKKSAKTVEIK